MSKALLKVVAAAVVLVLAAGCGSSTNGGAPKARPGTPAYSWAAASETFRNGDYVKASTHLNKLQGNAEYGRKAEPWSMIVDAGLAQGYMDLADRMEMGGKVNKSATAQFSRRVSQYRSAANTSILQLTETLHKFMDTNKDAEIVLAMPAPAGTAAEPSNVQKIAKGVLPQEADAQAAERAMLQRGVLLTLARAAGKPDDPAAVAQMLRQGEVKLPREEFMRAMANVLYDKAELYSPKKLDQPKRLQVVCNEAQEAIGSVKQNPKDKELSKKIQDTLKKYKLS